MTSRCRPFAFFLLLIMGVEAFASGRNYSFRPLTVDDGLAHNTVLAIIQDRTGFMWFGTKGGLNRYDGNEILRVTPENAIPGNDYITSLCEDADGKIWIGTDAGVCVYHPDTERSERYLRRCSDGSLITAGIRQIVMAPDKSIWIAAGESGFYHYDPSSDILDRIACDRNGRLSYSARSICFTSGNAACFALEDGNIYVSENNLLDARPLLDGMWSGIFSGNSVNKLVASSPDRIFVCSLRGLFVLNPVDGEVRKVELPHSNNYTRDIISVTDDELWVATENNIEILDASLNEIAYCHYDANSPGSLNASSVYVLYKDRDGGIWAGTYFAGMNYCASAGDTSFRHYCSSLMESGKLGLFVREMVADDNDDLWIGTESTGLFRMHIPTGEIEPVYGNDNIPFDYNCNIHGLCMDGDYIWVGTYDYSRTLVRIDRRTLQQKQYPSAGREIFSICKTKAGDLLLGTVSGLKQYDPAGDCFYEIPDVRSHIHHLLDDSEGNLWIATYKDGLYRRDASTGEWRHYLFDENDPSSLAADKVLSVFEDSGGRLWFTTEGGGLCRYDKEDDAFVSYLDVIPFPICYRVEEDAVGYFWITTNDGLVRLDPETFEYYVFTTVDGLLGNQFSYSSSCKSRDGRIYAGSNYGFISFDPVRLKPDDSRFPIVIVSLDLCNRRIVPGTENSQLERSITLTDRLVLRHNENILSLHVSSLNYRSPHKDNIRYRLEGFDTGWNMLQNNMIAYSGLPYRSYRLVIQGLGGNGEPDGVERTLDIRIRPPFYQTLVAKILYVLLLVSAIFLIRWYLQRNMRRKQEKIEYAKERELYIAKFDFFTNIAHEIRTPLSLIKAPLEHLSESLGNTDDEDIRMDIETIEQNTERLAALINQLLDFRKAEKGGFILHMEESDVTGIIKAICGRFASTARQRQLKMYTKWPDSGLSSSVDREAINKIISNLLSNAVKYAASYVSIEFISDEEQNCFRIIVENDGDVVPLEQRELIFNPFVRYSNGKHLMTGTGIGLTLARALAELHNGTLVMDDAEDVNRFILTVPVVHRNGDENVDMNADEEEAGADSVASRQKGEGKPVSMLIVEDDPDMLAFISRRLGDEYEVTLAENGIKALDFLEDGNTFDVIVSDVMMPGMDGFELCGRIKSDLRFSHIPVILLTAKIDVSSKITGVSQGADAYIEKPFSLEFLRTSISSLLMNRERLRRHFLESPYVKASSLTQSKADEKFIQRLHDYVVANLHNTALSVDDMAAEMCMSSKHLLRKLKAIAGVSTNEYLRIERLKRAVELMQQDQYQVADLAIMVGFGSASYFTTCFKKQFGITPAEFMGGRKLKSSCITSA